MKKYVVFSVGVAHPLYNKPVLAEIISDCAGYDGRQVYAKTLGEVFYPEDERGLLVYQYGRFVGYRTRPAYSERYEGYCYLA